VSASNVNYRPIGYVRSPFKEIKGMPIQPVGARGIAGSIEINPEFTEGLKDLDGFSHIFVLYHLHRISGYTLLVKPFLDNDLHGIFATRSPKRPNAIGLSVLQLVKVTDNAVYVENIDILDGTPVLDIKPYVPKFDIWNTDKDGWFAGKADNAEGFKADERFKS
jgi:tRNA-Thr(GGU) m(6)t(6)A37 methyltransferase TsaA